MRCCHFSILEQCFQGDSFSVDLGNNQEKYLYCAIKFIEERNVFLNLAKDFDEVWHEGMFCRLNQLLLLTKRDSEFGICSIFKQFSNLF